MTRNFFLVAALSFLVLPLFARAQDACKADAERLCKDILPGWGPRHRLPQIARIRPVARVQGTHGGREGEDGKGQGGLQEQDDELRYDSTIACRCTGWEEKADEHLPAQLGLPPGRAHLTFPAVATATSPRHWKLDAIDAFAGPRRPLAWVDDAHDDSCRQWAAQRTGPTLLVVTSRRSGSPMATCARCTTGRRRWRADLAAEWEESRTMVDTSPTWPPRGRAEGSGGRRGRTRTRGWRGHSNEPCRPSPARNRSRPSATSASDRRPCASSSASA